MTVTVTAAAAAHLQTAACIGDQLLAQAIRHNRRCTWVGPTLVQQGGRWSVGFHSLSGELYDGTSGVAVFLAELAVRTRDPATDATARAAIRHALEQDDDHGLYTGSVGTAVAAARVGLLLHDDELIERVRQLLPRLTYEIPDGFDLLSGQAGAVIGLLCLAAMLQEGGVLEAAQRAGTALIAAAHRRSWGLSWASGSRPHGRHLLGLSHGTAGVALALLRLYDATRDQDFRNAAEQALQYERCWYDPVRQNWPDLREATGRRRSIVAPYLTMWCHGAPGIALSRRLAARLLPDSGYDQELAVAVTTTCRSVESALCAAEHNYSLCHGVAGNADVLLSCPATGTEDLAAAAADYGADRYSRPGVRWPCGVVGAQEAPGLFLGLAGIGYLYLRLSGPDVPSVLDLDPHRLAQVD